MVLEIIFWGSGYEEISLPLHEEHFSRHIFIWMTYICILYIIPLKLKILENYRPTTWWSNNEPVWILSRCSIVFIMFSAAGKPAEQAGPCPTQSWLFTWYCQSYWSHRGPGVWRPSQRMWTEKKNDYCLYLDIWNDLQLLCWNYRTTARLIHWC